MSNPKFIWLTEERTQKSVGVNLDRVAWIKPHGDGAMIVFDGGEHGFVIVTDDIKYIGGFL